MKVTPHQLRHTFATQLINQDLPIDSVRKLLGHQTLNMTQHYARLSAGCRGVRRPLRSCRRCAPCCSGGASCALRRLCLDWAGRCKAQESCRIRFVHGPAVVYSVTYACPSTDGPRIKDDMPLRFGVRFLRFGSRAKKRP
ncbi:MAG: site-specific integrase [Caldilineaceae bacterium]|nr:site-specific integrase [Caldilineaceae bacterium]